MTIDIDLDYMMKNINKINPGIPKLVTKTIRQVADMPFNHFAQSFNNGIVGRLLFGYSMPTVFLQELPDGKFKILNNIELVETLMAIHDNDFEFGPEHLRNMLLDREITFAIYGPDQNIDAWYIKKCDAFGYT